MLKYILVLLITVFTNILYAQENVAKAYFIMNPVGDFVAKMKVVSGFATLEDGKYKAKNIVVDLNSLVTGMNLRDDHAKNKYLEVKKYPQAILVDAIAGNEVGKARIKIHGKMVIVNGTYKIVNSGKSLTAKFKGSLSSFGIADINYKGIGVEDEFKVEVTVPIQASVPAATAPKPPAKK